MWVCNGQGEYVLYKDPNQKVSDRVVDLLGRMTLEEKIGQMVQIDRSVATINVMRDYFIGMPKEKKTYFLDYIFFKKSDNLVG